MKIFSKTLKLSVVALCAVAVFNLAHADNHAKEEKKEVKINKAVPEFTVKDLEGKEHKLSDFKDKIVVLEWNNPGCPFVRKHYDTGNMQELQEKYTKKGVVWLTVNSGAKGKQGYMDKEEAKELVKKEKIKSTAYIRDEKGEVGKLFGARTTPHLFVIDKKGKLVYNGAIDDKSSTRKEDVKEAKNYVAMTIASLMEGEKPEKQTTRPYGCSVKY